MRAAGESLRPPHRGVRTSVLFYLAVTIRLLVLNFHMADVEPVIKSRAMSGLETRGRGVQTRGAPNAASLF